MRISGQVKGRASLLKKLSKLGPASQIANQEALAEAAIAVHSLAVRSIQAQGSNQGRETRYNPKREVSVSQPGNPPNSDTGRLAQSIAFNVDKVKLFAQIGTNLKYGAWLEFGTSDMRARPWLLPALRKAGPMIPKIFIAKNREELRKAVG